MAFNIKEEVLSDEDFADNEDKYLPVGKVEVKEEEELDIDSTDQPDEGLYADKRNDDELEEEKPFCFRSDENGASISRPKVEDINAPDFVSYEIVEYNNYGPEEEHTDNTLPSDQQGDQSVSTSGNDDHINVTPMNEWVVFRYMKMSCHLCGATFQHHVYKWLIHIKQHHPDIISKMEQLYHMYCKNVAYCKICKKNVSPEFNQVYHYLLKHHTWNTPLRPFVCSFCEYADASFPSLQKHQAENHPLVSTKCEKCPKCCRPFRDAAAVEFHFMTAHVEEFNTRFVCKCHLCKSFSSGSNKHDFFNHLMEVHKLDNWEALSFKKMEGSSYFLCTRCYKIYTNTDIHNLLNHYLTHDENSSWKCKFCRCKNLFKDWPLPHLCQPMWQYFKDHRKGAECEVFDEDEDIKPTVSDDGTVCASSRDESPGTAEAINLISIMCTLCDNKPFSDIGKISTHFRTVHKCFDEFFEKGSKEVKRVCKICQTTMNRDKPSDIMIHFLKHLDERPYKCIKCLRSFTEFRAAQKHAKVFHLTETIDIIGNMNPTTVAAKTERKTKKVVCPNNMNSFKLFEPYIVYACPECNEVMPNMDSWEDHINAQHTFFHANNLNIVFFGNGKGKCTDCNTIISISMSLQKTHKLTHMQYTPYICAICYERFSMLISLYRHMRHVHLAKGSIQCPLCPFLASTDCEKYDHVNQIHPRSEWLSNMCTKCYRIVDDMDTHRLTHEITQPKYRCECCGIYVSYHKDLEKHMQEMHGRVIVREKRKKKKSSKRKSEVPQEKSVKVRNIESRHNCPASAPDASEDSTLQPVLGI